MMTQTLLGMIVHHPPVRKLHADDPGHWVAAAWRDFRRAPMLSLAYGTAFVIFGYMIVLGLDAVGLGSLVPASVAGFFLIAPILAVSLYDISRRLESGEPACIRCSMAAWRRNTSGLATIGLVLMLFMAAWTQIAFLVFMGFFHAAPPGLDSFIHDVLTAPNAVPFLTLGTGLGMILATMVFSIAAISIPMVLDRDISAIVAIATSLAAVRENWAVMLGWAVTIVLLVGIGVVTFFAGLAITLPLCAYATWHAYRALVE